MNNNLVPRVNLPNYINNKGQKLSNKHHRDISDCSGSFIWNLFIGSKLLEPINKDDERVKSELIEWFDNAYNRFVNKIITSIAASESILVIDESDSRQNKKLLEDKKIEKITNFPPSLSKCSIEFIEKLTKLFSRLKSTTEVEIETKMQLKQWVKDERDRRDRDSGKLLGNPENHGEPR